MSDIDPAARVVLFILGCAAGWIMIFYFKSFLTQIKKVNEVIKKIIFGAAYPLIEVSSQTSRVTGNWTDNFVTRTVFDQFTETRAERDHALQEMEEEQERFDHNEIHPFQIDEDRLHRVRSLREFQIATNYSIQAQNAPTAAQLGMLQGGFSVTTTDRAGRIVQVLNHSGSSQRTVPPVTQENCMHYFQEINTFSNRAVFRICEICGYVDDGLPKTKTTLPNCKHHWSSLKTSVNGRGERVFGVVCIVCGKFKQEQQKSIAELRKSKTRSIILEIDSDPNLPSV